MITGVSFEKSEEFVNTAITPPPVAELAPPVRPLMERTRMFAVFVGLLVLVFSKPIFHLFQFAWNDELYSHIPLIPAVALYLLWLKRQEISAPRTKPTPLALMPLALGLGALVWNWTNPGEVAEDRYASLGYAFLGFLHAGALVLLGGRLYKQMAFPLCILIFAVPMPAALTLKITAFLQHGSADVAQVFLQLSGMPLVRSGTIFRLPGFAMEVAPQCSGIHSTLALLITSVLAGYVLLREKSRRWLLALAILPLALLRNALRIFTIGQLCVLVDPEIVHSFIHKRGGPVFFAFSLIPFLLLLVFLKRSELRRRNSADS